MLLILQILEESGSMHVARARYIANLCYTQLIVVNRIVNLNILSACVMGRLRSSIFDSVKKK
jgi:hypothetical protein